MILEIDPVPVKTHLIRPFLHGAFGEFFGNVIYDGTWVGKNSPIPNVDGIRKDLIDGLIEAGITAIRWPGGCCADHYHWEDGVGPERRNRLNPRPQHGINWRHDFGTDEFISLCRHIGAEPIITANVATGSPADFFNWMEYCNGDTTTRFGAKRAENGNIEPHNVTTWSIGNTDANTWHNEFNNPTAYAQKFLQWRTAVIELPLTLIGLGLSIRHKTPGWVETFLDYVTHNQVVKGPDALSIHHYVGGMKPGYEKCEGGLGYSNDAYTFTLNSVEAYQKDIDAHRRHIQEHVSPEHTTTIAFNEWGLWHPEAGPGGGRQPQTLRDALFAALTLHIFYRNSDIVEYAMVTQYVNLLHSLFETDRSSFYRTPTFYVLKLFKEHLRQYLLPIYGMENEPMLDAVASGTEDTSRIVLSLVNKDPINAIPIRLPADIAKGYCVTDSRTITHPDIRAQNTFDCPDAIVDKPFSSGRDRELRIPEHSIVIITIQKVS